MPGLYGGCAKNILSRMSKDLLVRPNLEIKSEFCDNIFEVGHISIKENECKSYKKDNIIVFIDGYVYNTDEIQEKFRYAQTIFSQQILLAYQDNKLDDVLSLANGYFVGVLYDQLKKKILLFSDRLGTRFLYYYHKDEKFLFSGEIKGFQSLEFVDKTIDSVSVECFVNGGNNFYLLGDNTYFKNIKLLKPATILEYDIEKNMVNQKYYWTFSNIKKQNISYEDAVDKLHDLVEKAVLKRVKGLNKDDFALPLSGGLDSRLIFAILNNYQMMPSFIYTNGSPNCSDVKYAKRLCKKYHYKHYINLPKNVENYLDNAKNTTSLTEGMCMFCEYGTYNFFPQRFVITGYVGDMVMGESFKSDPNMLDKRMDATIAEHFFGKFKELSDYKDHYFDIDKIEASLFINRVRRYTAQMLNIELNFNEQIHPYIDNDLIDFIYSIPDTYRANNHLYADMLLKYYPDYFKNIPWNRNDRPIQGKIYKNNKFNINWLIEKVENCSFLSSKWKKSILKRINYHKWFTKRTFHVFQEELTKDKNLSITIDLYNNSIIKNFISRTSWNEVLDNIKAKDTWKIVLFLTAEFYFRYLNDKK